MLLHFQVVYQNIIQLSYADKLLSETHIRFRDLYKNVLLNNNFFLNGFKVFDGFTTEFQKFKNYFYYYIFIFLISELLNLYNVQFLMNKLNREHFR